jgi:hypothetical protein
MHLPQSATDPWGARPEYALRHIPPVMLPSMGIAHSRRAPIGYAWSYLVRRIGRANSVVPPGPRADIGVQT